MKGKLFALAGWSVLCIAQPTQIQVQGSTPTQAVISYTAPSSADCTIEASENSTYSPVVNDVNATLFSGANSDARFSALRVGSRRVFIIGTRSADLALDGKLYSRALQQNTPHYYRLTCGSAATGYFSTTPIPFGDLHTESPPWVAAGFGNYGWPTIDWTNKFAWYIDPMTGMAYKPVNYPGEYANRYGPFLFGSTDFVTGPSWTNPGNIRSGSAATVATATTTTDPIYVGIDPTVTQPYLQNMTGINEKAVSIDDIGINVFGSGTDGTAGNRQFTMCLSFDWSTCYTSNVTVTLPTGSDVSVGTFPSTFPLAFFSGWGKAISREDLGRTGTVNVSGSTVTLTSGMNSDTAFANWVAGTRVWISGSSAACTNNLCTVVSVQSPVSMTISESVSLTGSVYKYGPALKIAKTNATGAINLSVSNTVGVSNNGGIPPGGSFEFCSKQKVSFSVDRDGNPSASKTGRMCAIDSFQTGVGSIYWIADDGETRMISYFRQAATLTNSVAAADIPNQAAGYPYMVGFSPSVATRWYTQMQCTNNTRCIYQLDYTGDGREWKPTPRYPTGNATQPSSPSDNVAWTILTKTSTGNDVQAQIDANYPAYDKTRWGSLSTSVTGSGVAGGYMMFVQNGYNAGESPICYAFVFSLATGNFVRAWDNYTGTLSPYMRWNACHATLSLGGPDAGNVFQSFNLNSLVWGAYSTAVTHVKKSGSYNTNTSLPAAYDGSYDGACPVNPYGATGNNCVFVKVAGEPCKTANLTNESTWFPCPWDGSKAGLVNMVLGDFIYETALPDNSERMQIIEKTVNSTTDIELTLKRDAVPSTTDPACIGTRVHANGWAMAMGHGGGRTCNISSLTIEPVSGSVYAAPLGDHFDIGVGPTQDFRWVSSRAYANGGLAQLDTTYPPIVTDDNPSFAGVSASVPPRQNYPSGRQWTAASPEKTWTMSNRHYTQWGYQTITQVSGNLYRLQTLGTPDIKRLPFLATAGQYLLQDISSAATGDTITPADTYKFCYAYRNDECRTGSTAGQLFIVVPVPVLNNLLCDEGTISINTPCAFVPATLGAWGTQSVSTVPNGSGRWTRRLSMQPGPQRHPPFENWRPFPDGKTALWRSAWTDGLYTSLMLAKLPPRDDDSLNRTTFVPVEVKASAGTNVTVQFGYNSSFYCTSRLEACKVSAATITQSDAFKFASEALTGATGPYTITIPALSGRVLYYRVCQGSACGATVVKAIP